MVMPFPKIYNTVGQSRHLTLFKKRASYFSGFGQYFHCDMVQYRTVQCSKYSTAQYSTVQYSTVQYSTVQYSTVWYSTVWYRTDVANFSWL